MRGIRRARAGQAEVSLTPMLDVVFILLIFFIVTSTFAREEAIGIEAPPPIGPVSEAERAMLIEISDSSVVSVNGRITDIGSVRAAIERVRAETPDIRIAIQVHPKARTGVIALVRDAAYNAGYREGVSLSLMRI